MTEITKRLNPTSRVVRELYLKSGNRCAHPHCNQPLIGEDGVMVGEIAHIEAALPEGPRFNGSMTNEERRAPANLMLLCATHHTVIDSDLDTWPVERLRELKESHERIYTGAVDRLRSTVGDTTEGTAWTPADNLGRLIDPTDLDREEHDENLRVVNDFARRLAAIPVGARSVLSLIVARGESTGIWLDDEVSIPAALLEQLAGCSRAELQDHLAVLEHFDLISLPDEHDGDPPSITARNSTPGIGWKVMQDIKELSECDQSVVRRVLVDLDFGALDA